MHILLTGGTGLIGRALCAHWTEQGHRLTVWSRQPGKVAALCGADVRGIARLEELGEEPLDAVINLAGAPIADRPWSSKRKALLWASRIGLSEQLLAWLQAREQRPALLLSGAAFTDGLTIVHTGQAVPSAPHIAMTVSMLRDAGVDVDDSRPNRWRVAPGRITAREWVIEPDLSNSVPFLAAAYMALWAILIGSLRFPEDACATLGSVLCFCLAAPAASIQRRPSTRARSISSGITPWS